MSVVTQDAPRRTLRDLLFRRVFPLLAGILILAVVGLSIYEIWVMNFGPDAAAYSYVVADPGDLPPDDARGAFLQLNPAVNTRFPTNLIGLTGMQVPGVISETQAIHVAPAELHAVLVRQSVIANLDDYRLYPLAADPYPMRVVLMPGGNIASIMPQDGVWRAGNYIVDTPSNGTFGGRDYYDFVVDEK